MIGDPTPCQHGIYGWCTQCHETWFVSAPDRTNDLLHEALGYLRTREDEAGKALANRIEDHLYPRPAQTTGTLFVANPVEWKSNSDGGSL